MEPTPHHVVRSVAPVPLKETPMFTSQAHAGSDTRTGEEESSTRKDARKACRLLEKKLQTLPSWTQEEAMEDFWGEVIRIAHTLRRRL